MNEIRYTARVLDNGNLSPPEAVELDVGEEVEVVLKRGKGPKPPARLLHRQRAEICKSIEENQRRLDELTARVTGPRDLGRNWSHHLYGNRLKPCPPK